MVKRKVTFGFDDEVKPDKLQDIPYVTNKFMTLPIHLPLILIGMFKFGITTNVKDVMIKSLTTLVFCQLIYSYLIYSYLNHEKKKANDNLILLLISSIVIPIILSVPIFFVIIIMGAPLSTHVTETYLLSVHISIILINPLIMLFKLNFDKFLTNLLHIEFRSIKNNSIFLSILISIIFTWSGVIPIPLDWDRPWQSWPITLLTGNYLGFFMGSFISLFI